VKPEAAPTSGEVVETRTTRRILPVPNSEESKTPEFWAYVRAILQADWSKHMVYLYRVEPKPSVAIQRTGNSFLTMPNGQQVSLADQEELEFALAANYGGGIFRLIVKKGPQWVTQERLEIGGPVRALQIPAPENSQQQPGVNQNQYGDAATAISMKAIDTVAGAEHTAVRIGIDALGAAANIVRSFGEGRPTAPSSSDQMMQQFMAAMIARMSVDPMQQFMQMLAFMKEINGVFSGGGNGGNGLPADMMQQFMKAMFEKFMNPTPAGSPVNTGAALVQMLPAIGNQFVEGLREFAKVRENEAKIIAMQRSGMPAPPQPNPQVLPPSAPNGAQPQPANGAPSVEFVDRKIIEFIKAPNLSAEQAADEAMSFLDSLDPHAVAQLSSLGEPGLLQLFSSRPILQQATSNMPRLVEFIRAFLRMHAEDVASEQGQAATQPQKPPLPN
jgi:hypothetical protein